MQANGRRVMVNEANPTQKEPRKETAGRFFPGFGHAVLGRGKGERHDAGVKLYCPEGLGIKGDARERTWEETYFPLRKFKRTPQLKVPTRLVRHLDDR